MAVLESILCYHCGEDCDVEGLKVDDKHFCCHGCKTVFEILGENGLLDYYQLEQRPGTKQKSEIANKYDFLGNEAIEKTLLDFASDKLKRIHFYIPTIHCSSCIYLLENLYQLSPGILRSEVNFPRKEVLIDFDPNKLKLKQLAYLLDKLGHPPNISLDTASKEQVKSANKGILIRIGIAGFAFGNIMLLSFPDYLGFDGLTHNHIKVFMGYLSMLLALPVVFYSASSYYISAFKGLKNKFINIDVPISLGISVLFLWSCYELISRTGTGYFDSLAGLIFFLLLGRWFQSKTYQGISFDRDYKSYFPLAITQIKDGKRQEILVSNLKKGDHILIRNNELIPCDSCLQSDYGVIDYSFVSGESEPKTVAKNELIYAGGRQLGESIHLQVERPVAQSYLTGLWNNEVFCKPRKMPLQSLIDWISKYFTLTVLSIAILAGIYWSFQVDLSTAIKVFSAVFDRC